MMSEQGLAGVGIVTERELGEIQLLHVVVVELPYLPDPAHTAVHLVPPEDTHNHTQGK